MQLTRFEDVQRPLAQFVRLLGQPATVAVHAAPAGVRRAFANEHGLFFPDSFPMLSGEPGRAVYYAAAAHLVAHSRFGGARWQRGSLRAVQVVLVSLLEDARVERRLAAELPGLLPLWRRYHTAAALEQVTFPALCARLSCALSDPGYRDEHPIIVKARLLVEQSGALWSAEDCRRIGSLLGNDVGQTRLSFSEREYLVEPVYRDDHRLLWEEPVSDTQPSHEHAEQLERARATAKAQPQAAALERASEPPSRLEGSGRGPQAEGAATAAPVVVSAPVLARYPEYDYLLGLSRPAFCTVREQAQASGPTLSGAPPQRPRRRLPAELQRLAGALRLQTRRRRGRERDGDGIDLDQALEARIDVLAQQTPDERVYVRTAQRRQKLALLVLLDLSASTAARVPNSETTLLELSREACLLLGDVLTHVGDALAIHGFSSNGRHEVEYHRFKDFSEPWNAATEARLDHLVPRLSTRMGAALRHATHWLSSTVAERRLLLLLTDGEPADVDAPDPNYLLHDARQAVFEGRRRDLSVLAVSLDASGAPYLRRIFGAGRYLVLPSLPQLPRVLADVYARLHV